MHHYIPRFIQEKFKSNKFDGEFTAITLLMDISGFTPMTESLMQHGKEGVEVLSQTLNDIFNPIIQSIYDRGGFITGFSGDAVTAVFPTKSRIDLLMKSF